jgi:uncharacterized protein
MISGNREGFSLVGHVGRIEESMAFNFKELENLLVCPGSRTKLIQDADSLVCLDVGCRLKFPIRDDIPIMLVDEALKLSPEDWGDIMQRHARDRTTGQRVGTP